MLCAAMTQDVYAVDFLVKGLRDSNALLREVAVELAALFNDRPLQLEVLRLLDCETVWDVRLEAIAAAGQMQLWEAVPKLTKILSNDRVPMEERGLAAASIVELRDGVQRSELIALVRSNCAGLRVLACKLVTEFDRVDDLDLIAPLLCDGRTEVRLEALNTIGVLRVQSIGGKSVEELVSSYTRLGDYKVAITAAWVMVLCGGDAEAFFTPWINHANAEVRLFAAAVLAACGRYGETAAQKILEKHTDPFVRVNLAIGLLGQRVAVEQSCDELYTFLMMQQKPLAWSSRANSLFSALAPSHLKRSQSLSKTPEAADMAVRLDLLRLLAMMGYPKTQEAVKRFLREKMWGISGIAAETLIEEGDQAAVDIVRNLLEDEDPTVRIQAALVLALWSREERAICVLQDAYPGAARELKTKILEALGRIGAAQSVPFLIEVLQDPFPVLRAVAASALITCLNH
jgi:HEAT repeat protein